VSLIAPRPQFTIPLPGDATLALGGRTLVMGVLNITPDSFSDGGRLIDPVQALDCAQEMEAAGVDLLDVGGESTRPGAAPVAADEEWARLGPVLERLAGRVRTPISVDTYKAEIARRAIGAGAAPINDISGLQYDPELGRVVAATDAAVVLMHTRGRPQDMYGEAHYDDVVGEVARELGMVLERAAEAGLPGDRIILDPGIGFAKRAPHSLAVLAGLGRQAARGRPQLVGPSRH
jgi:dihydropteroate synthase